MFSVHGNDKISQINLMHYNKIKNEKEMFFFPLSHSIIFLAYGLPHSSRKQFSMPGLV